MTHDDGAVRKMRRLNPQVPGSSFGQSKTNLSFFTAKMKIQTLMLKKLLLYKFYLCACVEISNGQPFKTKIVFFLNSNWLRQFHKNLFIEHTNC